MRTIIGKYWSRKFGCWMALVFQFGLVYSVPFNLSTSTH